MGISACESKQILRQRALNARGALPDAERALGAESAAVRVVALLEPLWAPERPLTVLTYASHGHEFPSEPVLDLIRTTAAERGLRTVVAYPRVSGPGELTLHRCERADLTSGYRDILEPPADAPVVGPTDIDVVLVPGVAFDESAMRLGYGKGFYDRALAQMDRALKVGLSFDETLFPVVPCETHDFPLDAVVTPTRVIAGPAR